jgi:transmembrane sensor
MTSADHSNSVDDARLNAAAEWLIALRENPTDPQVITAWLQWRQEHPDNPRAFSEIEEIWTMTGGAESALALTGSDHSQTSTPDQPSQHSNGRHRPVQHWLRWSVAAGLAATVIVSSLAWRTYRSADEAPVEYTTAQATQRELRLSDGSTLLLGGDSTVRVAYTATQRNIALLHGEAHFAVQHNTARPFVVRAHGIAVTAVGTAFNVRADDSRTVVSVSEGVVEVGPGSTTDKRQPMLQSTLRARVGQQVVLDDVVTGQRVTLSVQLRDTPAPNDWQEGILSFVDEPLHTVIARVNRYSQHNIAIADPTLGELRFTGTVIRDRIDDWALGLEKAFPIKVRTDVHGDITLASSRNISR